MCKVSKSMREICRSRFFWIKKFQKETKRKPITTDIGELKKAVKYIYELKSLEDTTHNLLNRLLDEYYMGNMKYANMGMIVTDIYNLILDILSIDLNDFLEDEEITIDYMDDEKDSIIEILDDSSDVEITEIKEIFMGFNDNKLSNNNISYNSMALWEYLDYPKEEILNFIYDILRKKLFIDTL